jgi:hypothetical protein
MRTLKKKWFVFVAAGMLAAVCLYLGAYFACVSIEFRYAKVATQSGNKGIGYACAGFKVGHSSQSFVRSFFEPARLLDAGYLRPRCWENKYGIY